MEKEFLKVSPREYQEKIFQVCKEKNCLVVLPTGLGKTLVALMLSIERLKNFPSEKILFLAPTKPLVEQHLGYFKKNLSELFADMQLFTGSIPPEKRMELWETANIIFSTPQCIANDLKNGLYNLNDVSLLVEDEAHRCLKNYDYNFVAQKYKEQAKNQRILGLTASPGSDIGKIKDICRNLSIEKVEVRTRNSEDVKSYLQDLEFERVIVDFPEEFEKMKISLKGLFDRYVMELRERNMFLKYPSKVELINLQKRISMVLSKGNKSFNYFLAASACAQAIKIQHALELLETQTLESFGKYLDGLKKQAEKKTSKGVVKLISSNEFGFVWAKTNELLSQNIEHPKISKTTEIITDIFLKNKDARIIIFTQFRDTASLVSKKLNLAGIKSRIFVGQAKKMWGGEVVGLSQKEQKKIIEDFSNGEINVLCATSIGEEGLDIPEVNAVIFYEPVASAIRKIQRAGRTARLMKGKLIILITKKTRDEGFYYASKSREKKMYSIMDNMNENLENKTQRTIEKYF